MIVWHHLAAPRMRTILLYNAIFVPEKWSSFLVFSSLKIDILKVQFFPGLATKDTMSFLVTPPPPAGIHGSSFHEQLLRQYIYAYLSGITTYLNA